ncbi:MAG TPA: beta-N-acetylhexosaminidase [Steroidobacteraceae bacterium]|jgi:beta-N-acetylhexosaminidase|nr:beta-N-acetylhexosaminidase [Steroidobacteraceae bacterium]
MSLGPLMIDIAGTALLAEDAELLRHPLVGGVILFARNYAAPAQLAALVRAIHAARSPPLIVAVDQEGGRVQRFHDGFTRLPAARRIGHEYDLDPRAGVALARSLGWLMAAELRAHGVDISFAPCVDLDNGVSEVIGDRSFHGSPEAVAQLAQAWVTGMREAGMAATAKHYPGHGAVVADSHHTLPVDRRPLVDLAPDLTPYRRLIANGLPGVMVAHLLYPAVDSAPASLSSLWIRDVLRGELGFQGVVFADDLSMGGAAAAYGNVLTRARAALSAGCDMLPVCNNRSSVIEVLDGLDVEPQPASSLRLVRLHGRAEPADRAALMASAEWRDARARLDRMTAAPSLTLDPGKPA